MDDFLKRNIKVINYAIKENTGFYPFYCERCGEFLKTEQQYKAHFEISKCGDCTLDHS